MAPSHKKHLAYIPALDGVRALAILLVMLGHAAIPGFAGGGFGVDIFFVLSGFLITTLLLEELDDTHRINLRYFYARRLLRLYPPLLLLLVLYAVFFHILRHVLPHAEDLRSAKDIALAGFYLTDYAVAFGFENRNSLLAHTWSLAVEEHFYLIWPFLLPLLRRWFPGRRLVAAFGVLYVIATLWRLACLSFQPWDMVYFRFDTRLSGLVLGACLGAMHRAGTKISWAAPGLLFSGLVFLIFLVAMPSMTVQTYASPVAEIFAFFLLYRILEERDWKPRFWLSQRAPVFFGRISYALYLFHFPIVSLMVRGALSPGFSFEVSAALAAGLAWFSWNTVEKAGRLKAKDFRRKAEAKHVAKEKGA